MGRGKSSEYRMVTALSVLTLAGLFVGLFSNGSVASAVEVNSPLISSDRSSLAICIQADDPAVRVRAADTVKDALDELQQESILQKAFGSYSRKVSAHCPGAAHLLKEGVTHPLIDGRHARPNRVMKASPFRVHVYVVTEAKVNQVFKKAPLRVGGQEWLCNGDGCAEVTTALYLTPADLQNLDFVVDGVAKALGVRLLFPNDEVPHHSRND